MREVADGVWQIPLTPRDGVSAYLLGDVLVDAGTPRMGRGLVKRLGGRGVSAHTITHAHPDHVGGSKAVLDALGVPFWAPDGDADACQTGRPVQKDTPLRPLMERGARVPPVPVSRRLVEGDEVAGFRVLDTPGHSPGHVSFWREDDRVLVCGDVWFNLSLATLRPKLRAPIAIATIDPARNRASMQRLVDLRPNVVCFGHGPVLTDAADRLRVV